MQAKLTNTVVKKLAPGVKPYEVVDIEQKGFLLRVQPSGVMTYYLSYRTEEGKRTRFNIGKHGTLTLAQARDIARQKSGEVAQGTDIQAAKKAIRAQAERAKLQTLGGFLEQKYKPWVLAERKSGEQTLQRIEHHFSSWFDKPLMDINRWLVTNWRAQRLKNGQTPNGANRIVGLLTAIMNKAVEWEVISFSPLNGLKPLKIDRSPNVRYLSTDEEKRLRTALDERQDDQRKARINHNQWLRERGRPELAELTSIFTDHIKPMVLLAMKTGLRRGELFSLTWKDADLKGKMLTVAGSTAKSGHTRHIPLNREALGILIAWRNQTTNTDLVFPSPVNAERLDNINSAWQTVLEKAKLSNFRFHDLRHHFASSLVMKGADLNTVRELLGHSDLAMTLRYAHLAPEHKSAAVALLD